MDFIPAPPCAIAATQMASSTAPMAASALASAEMHAAMAVST